MDPANKAVFQEDKESSGTFSFVSSMTGQYSVCLSNAMSTVTSKLVNFHFHVGNALSSHQVAKKEHLSGLEISVLTLSEGASVFAFLSLRCSFTAPPRMHAHCRTVGCCAGVSFLKDNLDFIKTRERLHRDTSESSNSRVMWWSISENIVRDRAIRELCGQCT